ncbi:unnamed protein product [Bursaphelenchus okinawaensis]|uniref:Uncharacterized protein n=1 Tax=Bursaphelenchus okinawaensis TaxID=465554 RepID=A0A811KU92_9BILA|nr:unnamed protein product [Bursaphelenchus okinawaensis]CAG9111054.1 unnamed protein product [Bursaphelenchus okinawaensis]
MAYGYIRWVVTTPVQKLDMCWHYFALFLMNLGIEMVCCTMLLEFVFRYLMICRNYTMTKCKIAIVLTICLCVFAFHNYSGIRPVKESTERYTDSEINQIFSQSFWKINGTLLKGIVIEKVI